MSTMLISPWEWTWCYPFTLKHLPYKQIKTLVLVEHKSKYDKKLYKQALGYITQLYF